MDRDIQRDLYREFLLSCTRNPNSASNYSDFKRINECIQELYPDGRDVSILDFDNADEFKQLVEKLNRLQKYIEYH